MNITLDKIIWQKQKKNLINNLVTGRLWKLAASITKGEVSIRYSECSFKETANTWHFHADFLYLHMYGTQSFCRGSMWFQKLFQHSTPKSDHPQRAEYAKEMRNSCAFYIERFNKFLFLKDLFERDWESTHGGGMDREGMRGTRRPHTEHRAGHEQSQDLEVTT